MTRRIDAAGTSAPGTSGNFERSWIFLVGFMAVGKTTLGRGVAARLEMPFVDLDTRIERFTEKSVAALFEELGETGFRGIETEVLTALLETRAPAVVATGGGAFTVEHNRRLMADAGTSVWLDAPFDTLRARARSQSRPLWSDPERAQKLAQSREKYYGLATFHLELGDDSVTKSTDRLYRLLAKHRNA